MALIGYSNRVTTDIYIKLLENETISKLLYYNNELDEDVENLPPLENPTSDLKHKIFKNRRLERLQREADVGMTISIYSKSNWKKLGKSYDKSIENVVEVGVVCHEECDDTLNGSRAYAIMDLVIKELSDFNIDGLGKIHFASAYKTKDLPIEYSGYLLYFNIFSMKEDV